MLTSRRSRHVLVTAALLSGGLGLAAAVSSPAALAGDRNGRPLSTGLTGAEEVPGPGDADGSGTALLRVNPGRGTLCYELSVKDIAPATGAHVHEAPAGAAGPIVVALKPPASGTSSGCVDIGRALARDIVQDPSDYYVNVHNDDFKTGALRGQLG